MKSYSGNQVVDLRMGKIGEISVETARLIAEAVLSATTVLGDIEIKSDSNCLNDSKLLAYN